VLRKLIKLGANLRNSDADGLKPIHVSYNNIGAFQILLKKGLEGGNIDEDIHGRSPLFFAIREKRELSFEEDDRRNNNS